MEILDKKIEKWLEICYGYGYGYGDGYGDGSGYGDGDGSGYGDGYGSGYGSGYGDGDGSGCGSNDSSTYEGTGSGFGSYGSGSGEGLKSINKQKIYIIDGVNTIIKSIHNNIARGYIVKNDFTFKKCYIAKGQNKFAHGETIKQALKDLEEKIMEDIDIEEVIEKFTNKFPDYTKKYKASDFYQWHNYLTGSCEMGREVFAKEHNINIGKDKMTVQEFIELTENQYGGEIIKELKQYYKGDIK